MTPDFDTWQRGIRRASCRIFAAFCLVLAALQTRALVTEPFALRSTGVTAIGILVLLTAGYRGWRGRLGTWDAFAFTLLVLATAAEPYLRHHREGTGGDANPAFFILAATFLAYIVTFRGLAVPLAIASATGLYVTISATLGDRMLAPVLDESVILATSQVAVWMLFRQLAGEAVRADHAHGRTIAEHAEAARRTAEQEAVIAARRTLHDRVLAVLVLLANHVPEAVALRTECRRAARAVAVLGRGLGRADAVVHDDQLRRRIEDQAEAVTATTGVVMRLRRRGGSPAPPVPERVAEAVCEAVAESLRNVGRHAGVLRADVTVSGAVDGGLLVEVVDNGRGLPAGFTPGFGLRHSVTARIREVGGEAEVRPQPAGGTRVALHWRPAEVLRAPDPVPGAELSRIPSHPRAFAGAFAGVLLVGSLYLAVRYPTSEGPGWVDAAVCAGVVAFTLWCVLAVSRPDALRRAHAAGFVILPALLAVGLSAAGDGGLRGFECWVVGLSGIPVVLLAMLRPALPVLALAALEGSVVAAAAVLDPTLTPFDVLAPITQTTMFSGLVVYGVIAINRVRRAADTHELDLSAALARSQEVAVREQALGSHYAWLSSEVRPFLEAVADGVVDPAQPEVRQRAGVLAHAVRDELAVPAQLPDAFRRHIASARERGIRVRVRATDQWSAAIHHRELEELLALLATDEGLTDITLSLPQPPASPRVVVRPRLSTLQHSAAVSLLGTRLQDIDEDDLASIITLHAGRPEYV